MIEPLGLVPFLLSDAGVKAIVDTGVYPFAVAQGKPYPRITHQRISTNRVRSNDGPTGLCTARVQLDCWAEGPGGMDTAKALADAVRKARGTTATASADAAGHAELDGFKGRMGSVTVQGAFLDEDQDLSEDPIFGNDQRVHRISADLTITFEESLS